MPFIVGKHLHYHNILGYVSFNNNYYAKFYTYSRKKLVKFCFEFIFISVLKREFYNDPCLMLVLHLCEQNWILFFTIFIQGSDAAWRCLSLSLCQSLLTRCSGSQSKEKGQGQLTSLLWHETTSSCFCSPPTQEKKKKSACTDTSKPSLHGHCVLLCMTRSWGWVGVGVLLLQFNSTTVCLSRPAGLRLSGRSKCYPLQGVDERERRRKSDTERAYWRKL